jgi:hypothetical protein
VALLDPEDLFAQAVMRELAHEQELARERERKRAEAQRTFWKRIEERKRTGKRRFCEILGSPLPWRRQRYLAGLKEVIAYCLDHEVTHPLLIYLARQIRMGIPVDPKVLYLPRPSLQIILRQVVTALPDMTRHHADARLWLKSSQYRPMGLDVNGGKVYPAQVRGIGGRGGVLYEKGYEETFVPFNLLCYAPKDTPYEKFNKVGFTLEFAEDLDSGERDVAGWSQGGRMVA